MNEPAEWTQNEVLTVTGADPATLQNWVNRGRLVLSDQNPGRGRRRLYTASDVVQIAIMTRLGRLGIDVRVAGLLADETARALARDGTIEWDLIIPITAEKLSAMMHVSRTVSSPPFYSWGAERRDAREISVAELIEGRDLAITEIVPIPLANGQTYPSRNRRLRRADHTGPIVPEIRDALARQGKHAEPVLIFPLGEVVNGTLMRLAELKQRELET